MLTILRDRFKFPFFSLFHLILVKKVVQDPCKNKGSFCDGVKGNCDAKWFKEKCKKTCNEC